MWDEQPARVQLAQAIAGSILARVPVTPAMTALDFGCGTGLVTMALAPHVGRIIGVDTSPAMLDKLREKAAVMPGTTVDARLLDLTVAAPPADLRADLVVSAMAMHHIADLPALLRVLVGLLAPGGWLALADLDSEDGTFHPDLTDVYHLGIDRAWLQTELATLGLRDLHADTAHVIERPTTSGKLRSYPVFLVSGRR